MDKIIAQGKTTNEAIENGLKELKVTRNQVEIKVLEQEDKRSFFSILTPRVVKVELKLKESEKKTVNKVKEYDKNMEEIEEAKKQVEAFLDTFLSQMDSSLTYESKIEDYTIMIEIKGNVAGTLIGYRGETLNALQTILSAIANKKASGKIKLTLDIENYREKRKKVLEDLANKVSKTVLRTGKSITLEPMTAYERKIIHSKLQDNPRIETHSIGENDNRRIVISKI